MFWRRIQKHRSIRMFSLNRARTLLIGLLACTVQQTAFAAATDNSLTLPCGLKLNFENRSLTIEPGDFAVAYQDYSLKAPMDIEFEQCPESTITDDLLTANVGDRLIQWQQSIHKSSAVSNLRFRTDILVEGSVQTLKADPAATNK